MICDPGMSSLVEIPIASGIYYYQVKFFDYKKVKSHLIEPLI